MNFTRVVNMITNSIVIFLDAIAWPLLKILAVVSVALIIAALGEKLVSKLIKKAKITDDMVPIVRTGTKYSIYFIAAVYCMSIVFGELNSFNPLWFASAGFTIVKAVIVLITGLVAISYAEKLLRKALSVSKLDAILHSFICSTFKITAFIILAISCVDILGVPTTSLIAAVSAAGLALSLAVKDSISNLFGGIVVIITKPFVSGDYIELDGYSGKVAEIGLIYTTLYTFDNKKVFIPNNDAAKAKITNHSAEPTRRLDLKFTIGYKDNIKKAKEIILKVANASGLVLPGYDITVGVSAQSPNGIEIITRIWVDWPEYYNLQFYMLEQIKEEFEKEGITIPYNQLAVHIVNPK